jgi:hypothetical protein
MQLFFEKRKVLFTKIMSKERNIHQKVVTLQSKRNYWFSPTLIIYREGGYGAKMGMQ